jgi:DNA-binding NarL/FixJ family response regulator
MALDILNRGDIGTVIADIHMPSMNGIALLKKIRKQWPVIRVILITGYYYTEESISDDALKPDGFLMKPFKIQNITELLQSLAAKRSR